MTNVNWERWARATGIVFVVLVVVSLIMYGNVPKIDESSKIASFYTDHRGRILAATVIFSLALVFLIWFVAAIASTLREAGKGGWGAATIGLGAAFAGLQAVFTAIGGGFALNIAAAGGNDAVLQALNTIAYGMDVIAGIVYAGLIFAATTGLWRARLVPDWLGWLGML